MLYMITFGLKMLTCNDIIITCILQGINYVYVCVQFVEECV